MRVLIASGIAAEALSALRESHDVVYEPGAPEDRLEELIRSAEALVFRSGVTISSRVLAHADKLRLIVRAGSGYDNIHLPSLTERKITVVRIPGPGAKSVAELSFALMLALSRQLLWADSSWRAGHWVKPQASGRLLTGKVLGIVGAGNIGSRTGQLGAAWGMEVLGSVEHQTPDAIQRLRQRGMDLVETSELLARSEFVSVHLTLKDSTRGLLDLGALLSMKPGSILVNLSRGGVVDEVALKKVLESGHLAGAALDVHEVEGDGNISPLAELDNVILTPHIGAATVDSQAEIGELIVGAIRRYEHVVPESLATVDNFIVI